MVVRLTTTPISARYGKGWATQLLQEVAALRVHFSPARRKMQVSAAFLFLRLATFAPAQWIEKNSHDENSFDGHVVHRHIDVAESQTNNSAIIDLALFSTKSRSLGILFRHNLGRPREDSGRAAGRFQNPARAQSRWRLIKRVLVSPQR